ncbi:MAG: recombination regulator RecX [uncultured bacterium]|nr:MAG: recombination regulator RecX [uncultured bacterium]HLB57452.1 regulatory protein RecX [Gammaproteobacteria bacterium]
MDLLARREHSEKELWRKLLLKGFSEPDIHLMIEKLVQEKLINHDRFIEHYIYSRRTKGFGPLRIKVELIQRGLSEELIDHHLKIADNAWFTQILAIWQKRFKNSMPNDPKSSAKHMRFLQQRGFTSEQIKSILNSEDHHDN